MNQVRSATQLAVDIGNTSISVGVFDEGDSTELPRPARSLTLSAGAAELGRLSGWLPTGPSQWCVSSVHGEAEHRLRRWVQGHCRDAGYNLLSHTDLPLAIEVDHPHRVGMDRLAGAVAANRIREPHWPAIVVDVGTAVNVDLIGADGSFRGGAILPGMALVARALSMHTDQLPLVQLGPDEIPAAVGKSTEAAIRSGLFWGTVGALREFIQRMDDQTAGQPQLLLTGGDAHRIAASVSHSGHLVPYLVLSGIAIAARHIRGEGRSTLT